MPDEVMKLIEEGLGILNGLIDNINAKGNYSPESTCVFIDQAGSCFRAALSAIPHTGGVSEPGAIRICPMRDGPCQHGLDCPYVGDGPYGYPCKEGWRSTLSGDA